VVFAGKSSLGIDLFDIDPLALVLVVGFFSDSHHPDDVTVFTFDASNGLGHGKPAVEQDVAGRDILGSSQ